MSSGITESSTHHYPVSPFFTLPTDFGFMCGICEEQDNGYESIESAPIVADPADVRESGLGDIIDDEEPTAIQPGNPLPEPITPSKKEIDLHNLTHLPYRSWCKYCVRCRRPNGQHRRRSSRRLKPLLVADYCQVRDHSCS